MKAGGLGSARRTRKDMQQLTREKLLAAAHSSIVEEGVASISIRSICGAAGYSQGAFYSNFVSKDDLLVELMEAHIHEELAILRDLVRRAKSADIEETLRLLADRLADLAVEPRWSLLSIELQLHARRDAAFAARHSESKNYCYRLFAELVEDLVERFALTPALPPREASVGLYALWMGMAVQGNIDITISREQMLVGFFRAITGVDPQRPEASPS